MTSIQNSSEVKLDEEKEEKQFLSRKSKSVFGYLLPTNSICISITSIFAALICVITILIAFPLPATEGFINIGDAGVMITGLLFGPIVGGLAGGIGSMFADLILGYPIYAPATLIIKGLEGLVVGLIANPRKHFKKLNYRDVIGVIIGGLIMVFGYLIYEILLFGPPAALLEFFFNSTFQFGLSLIIALIFAATVRNNIINTLPQAFEKVFLFED